MQTTANYELKKPDGTDVVDIQNFNDNFDVIDTKIKEAKDAASTQSVATTTQNGLMSSSDKIKVNRMYDSTVLSNQHSTDDPNTTVLPIIRTKHANCPTNATWYDVFTSFTDNTDTVSEKIQIAMAMEGNNQIFARSKAYNSAYTPWRNIADGGNANTIDNIDSTGFARIHSVEDNFGNGAGMTTAEFITMLLSLGAFSTPYWTSRGSWSYGTNNYITDSGFGNIHLAGAFVEVIGNVNYYTIRICTAPTSSISNAATNSEFVYVNNGSNYTPTWRKIWNSKDFNPKQFIGNENNFVYPFINGGDLNLYTNTTRRLFCFNCTNFPPQAYITFGWLDVDYYDGNGFAPGAVVRQIFTQYDDPTRKFERCKTGTGAWSSWIRTTGSRVYTSKPAKTEDGDMWYE